MKRLMFQSLNKGLALLVLVLSLACLSACNDDDSDDLRGVCNVAGRVVDTKGTPLGGVNVKIYPLGLSATGSSDGVTDSEGRYLVKVENATKTLILNAEAEGYKDVHITLSDIPFSGGLPGESLGEADITVEDIIMEPNS